MRFRKEAIASGEIQDVPVPPESKFHVAQDTCRSISFKRLVSAEQTYANQGAAIFASSFLDWQTAPDGAIGDIVLGEIACLGHRDKRCNLKFYWNQTSGSGPWTPHNSTVLLPGENHLTRQRT